MLVIVAVLVFLMLRLTPSATLRPSWPAMPNTEQIVAKIRESGSASIQAGHCPSVRHLVSKNVLAQGDLGESFFFKMKVTDPDHRQRLEADRVARRC